MDSTRPTLAIVNGSLDVIAVLEERLSTDFHVVHASARTFRLRQQSLPEFMEKHRPRVVLWDVSLPYIRNWAYLREARASGALVGSTLVVTSPNPSRLDDILGITSGAVEIDDAPDRLEEIRQMLLRAATQTPDA